MEQLVNIPGATVLHMEKKARGLARRGSALIWAASGAIVAFAVSGCAGADADSGPFSLEEIGGATAAALDPPSAVEIFPGTDFPHFETVGSRPEDVVALDIEVSLDGGETWGPAFDSPLTFSESGSYSVSGLDSAPDQEEDFIFRTRWVTAGPGVSNWSKDIQVHAAAFVPPACRSALQAAASVPMAETNDDEIAQSLNACQNMEQWITGLYLYPQATVYHYGQLEMIDPESDAGLVCDLNPSTAACSDRGLGLYSR